MEVAGDAELPPISVWGEHLSPLMVLLLGMDYTQEAADSAEKRTILGSNRNKINIIIAAFTESDLCSRHHVSCSITLSLMHLNHLFPWSSNHLLLVYDLN